MSAYLGPTSLYIIYCARCRERASVLHADSGGYEVRCDGCGYGAYGDTIMGAIDKFKSLNEYIRGTQNERGSNENENG